MGALILVSSCTWLTNVWQALAPLGWGRAVGAGACVEATVTVCRFGQSMQFYALPLKEIARIPYGAPAILHYSPLL
jgi:hypothetical protein